VLKGILPLGSHIHLHKDLHWRTSALYSKKILLIFIQEK